MRRDHSLRPSPDWLPIHPNRTIDHVGPMNGAAAESRECAQGGRQGTQRLREQTAIIRAVDQTIEADSTDPSLAMALERHGVRNTHLTSIAPTGMLSLAWADNASPGIEPVFAHDGDRLRRGADGRMYPMGLSSPALRRWRLSKSQSAYPPAWITVDHVSAQAQIAMVAALQPWVDGGISKTLALQSSAEPAALARWLRLAWRCGLKGLAIYRRPAE